MGTNKNAPLAQPDRVFGYEPKGQGFESLTARQNKRERIHPLSFVLLVCLNDSEPPHTRKSVLFYASIT